MTTHNSLGTCSHICCRHATNLLDSQLPGKLHLSTAVAQAPAISAWVQSDQKLKSVHRS